MTFLTPLYLLGLAAAAIPIVIHLLTRKRPRRIPFSSVAFLREVNVAQLRRFRLRELLLLALRVLAIALLTLALSRPALKGTLGSLSAPAALATAERLELLARQGDAPQVPAALTALEASLVSLSEELAAVVR